MRQKLGLANELYIAVKNQVRENREALSENNLIAIQNNGDSWYLEIVGILQQKFEKLWCKNKYTTQLSALSNSFKIG